MSDVYIGYGMYVNFVFFFQAEDGIRDHCVTGVQTCALPIYHPFLNRDPLEPSVPIQENIGTTHF